MATHMWLSGERIDLGDLKHCASMFSGAGLAQSTWTYPDGTQSVRQPRDGEPFNHCQGNGQIDHWTWDGLKQQWFRTGHTANVKVNQAIEFVMIDIKIGDIEVAVKCQCGAEKTGSNRHSTWCDKFDHGI